MSRYARQTVLPEVGENGQRALAAANVVVIGAGGLGSILLQLLCGAGVGRCLVVDFDRVEESNLHRQPLYRMQDIGALKVDAARAALLAANPEVIIDTCCESLTPANVSAVISGADLVVDAADSLAVSYILSDACRQSSQVLVSASVVGLAGYVGAFCGGAPSYRAVFPQMPTRAGNCASDGVLGSAVSIIASVQAQISLAMLLGMKPSPLGRLIRVDCQRLHVADFDFNDAPEPIEAHSPRFIARTELLPADFTIDLRNAQERAEIVFDASCQGSVDELSTLELGAAAGQRIILCCRSGMRAWRGAQLLQARGFTHTALLALG